MKKFVLAFAVMLISMSVMAQREEGTATVQPRVGMNLSSMTDYNRTKFGYNFGVEFEYQMTEQFSLVGALMYSDQGARDIDELDKEEILDIDYVNVPIMLNFYVAPYVLPGLAIKAGVQPSFRTKTTVRYDGMKMDVDWLLKQAGYEDTKMSKFMLSIPVGISYELANVVLDARYIFGVTDIYKGEGKMRNDVFQLTLGYKFDADF
jgi:hypothetical protein